MNQNFYWTATREKIWDCSFPRRPVRSRRIAHVCVVAFYNQTNGWFIVDCSPETSLHFRHSCCTFLCVPYVGLLLVRGTFQQRGRAFWRQDLWARMSRFIESLLETVAQLGTFCTLFCQQNADRNISQIYRTKISSECGWKSFKITPNCHIATIFVPGKESTPSAGSPFFHPFARQKFSMPDTKHCNG